ncbi:hypothetical protein [Parvularcula lutaonensis]|uniref:Uncharacterized protein n=1 Tax=Parvularcula lutaonensis TaxID=491923 RepID=A0ABV7MBV4_9PROT|nr:hypothetical protein [Parvularcula lutaonensis]GGY48751.1 hypothetical protein GCM10007148_16550 [Parvularcula lutaonensis]
MRGGILVRGAGYAPWLAACLFARFVPASLPVGVETGKGSGRNALIRPEDRRALAAIGVDSGALLQAQARRFHSWGGRFGHAIPFSDGKADGFEVDGERYRSLLSRIARRAEVRERIEAPSLTVVVSDGADLRISDLALGAARLPAARREEFEHLCLVRGVMAVVFALPGEDPTTEEMAEMTRLSARHSAAVEDMLALLEGGEGSENLAHRKALFRACGRVAPFDDDPFGRSEWHVALLKMCGQPEDHALIAGRTGRG